MTKIRTLKTCEDFDFVLCLPKRMDVLIIVVYEGPYNLKGIM